MTIKMTISSTLDLAKAIFSCKGICEYMLKRKVQGHICCPVCERSGAGCPGGGICHIRESCYILAVTHPGDKSSL